MNQRAKDGLYQLLERTPVDGRSKVKLGTKVMEKTPNTTTKCCYSCEEEGHLSRNWSKKRERLPTTIVEYEENEVRDLLALERPKKRRRSKTIARYYALIAGSKDILWTNAQKGTTKQTDKVS
jgi:hypothetical protein